jgi:Double zinc ribbon
VLRRERRALLRVREERLRDLGGLMLEMYRRDQFRQDLLVERCEELMALDDRLQELDTLLAAALSTRRIAPPARCTCGAPLTAGSHFCANCGRAVTATPPVVACANCGAAVSAEARFCAACGHAVATEQQPGAADVQEERLEALPPAQDRPAGG